LIEPTRSIRESLTTSFTLTPHQQGDTGEWLHAMDFLVYAYLQRGHDQDAAQVIQQLRNMSDLNTRDFKIAYASTAMPIRYSVERDQW